MTHEAKEFLCGCLSGSNVTKEKQRLEEKEFPPVLVKRLRLLCWVWLDFLIFHGKMFEKCLPDISSCKTVSVIAHQHNPRLSCRSTDSHIGRCCRALNSAHSTPWKVNVKPSGTFTDKPFPCQLLKSTRARVPIHKCIRTLTASSLKVLSSFSIERQNVFVFCVKLEDYKMGRQFKYHTYKTEIFTSPRSLKSAVQCVQTRKRRISLLMSWKMFTLAYPWYSCPWHQLCHKVPKVLWMQFIHAILIISTLNN